MICKWCGANLASSDIKCKRCGKEIPALSDCGGFYDLVPNAKKSTEVYTEPVVVPEKPIVTPQKTETAKVAPVARSKKTSKKSLLGLTAITILGFVLVVLLLAITLGKVNQYAEAINGLQADMQNITEKLNVATEPPSTESTDHLDVVEPVLSKQNVVFTVLVNGDDAKKVDTSLDLGDYCDTAVITYDVDNENGLISFASYSLKEANTSTSFTIDYSNGFLTQDILVSYVIDDAIYGLTETSPICKWQYCIDEDAEWKDLPVDAITQTDDNGKTKISIKKAAQQDLVEGGNGILKLRCEICCTSADGGSMTIVVEGIVLPQEANNEEQIIG